MARTLHASQLVKGDEIRVMDGADHSFFARVSRVREGSFQERLVAGCDDRPAIVLYVMTSEMIRLGGMRTRGLTLLLDPQQPVKVYKEGKRA